MSEAEEYFFKMKVTLLILLVTRSKTSFDILKLRSCASFFKTCFGQSSFSTFFGLLGQFNFCIFVLLPLNLFLFYESFLKHYVYKYFFIFRFWISLQINQSEK